MFTVCDKPLRCTPYLSFTTDNRNGTPPRIELPKSKDTTRNDDLPTHYYHTAYRESHKTRRSQESNGVLNV